MGPYELAGRTIDLMILYLSRSPYTQPLALRIIEEGGARIDR